jgi:hypothetical protein
LYQSWNLSMEQIVFYPRRSVLHVLNNISSFVLKIGTYFECHQKTHGRIHVQGRRDYADLIL